MLNIRKEADRHDERIGNVEMILFKDNNVGNLIEGLRTRIEEGETAIRKEISTMKDKNENKVKEIEEKMFNINNRITANEILKDQFEVFKSK